MPEVLCIGELLIDFVSSAKGVALRDAPGFTKAPGGAPANVAAGLAKLGRRAGFIGKVGADAFGDFLKTTLDDVGVDTAGLVRDPEVHTTLAFVAVGPDGSPDFSFYRNPGADMMLRTSEINTRSVRSARAFHFGSIGFSYLPCRKAQRTAIQAAREADALLSYDPNLRLSLWPAEPVARDWIWRGFETCDVAKVSEEEWPFITGTTDLATGAAQILGKGVQLLAVSLGEKGCYYDNGRFRGMLPGFRVRVAETTGAGDAFVAAMLDGLLDACAAKSALAGLDEDRIQAILTRANKAGALACTQVGAIPALPTKAELDSAELALA